MPEQGRACAILRYHLKEIARSLPHKITTSKAFLRYAARSVFEDNEVLGFPPSIKVEFHRAMNVLHQSGEVRIQAWRYEVFGSLSSIASKECHTAVEQECADNQQYISIRVV